MVAATSAAEGARRASSSGTASRQRSAGAPGAIRRAGPGARLVPGSQGEKDGDAGDAVQRHRPLLPVGGGDRRNEVVQVGEGVVGDDELDRSPLEAGPGARVEARPPGDHDVLREGPVGDAGGEQRQVVTALGRGGVGEARYAVAEQGPANGAEVERFGRYPFSQPRVEPEEPAGGT